MNKLFAILCIVLVLILAVSTYAFFGFSSQVLGSKTFGMFLTVGDKLGFNIDSNAVYFGKTTPDSMAKRDMLVSNNFDEKVLVTIEKSGALAEWVTPSLKNFYLNAQESKTITLTVTVPSDAKKADYTGLVTVYYIKAND